ncbi:hypothetical protein PPTG_18505 [Phytophthora nicotianae INRA-310]|uniref:Helitron helicase-like domain-containing protein n=1 Tax=Phytophthora nicotianae (strain INRA-310) TaxID=761204 RepID=W2PIA2_PHYN3|nr:hypothetical protein PPTG_18505 [Phytophthora nicotianae INRA-310]ETM99754.1 hypothetical protein PPTG_18505 [Phytophthora nicotianae INRA-310]
MVTAQYTGITSVDTLFDILESKTPTKSDLREASLKNDSASAKLFIRQVDAFIRFVLGVDPKTNKPSLSGGLLGDVQAYFGMVETQGRGTLHIHFLVWLTRCPPNSAAIDSILKSEDGDRFCASVASYADSIVRNELPIRLDGKS